MEPMAREGLEHSIVVREPVLVLHLLEVLLEECRVVDLDRVFKDKLDVVKSFVEGLEFDADAEEHAGLHLFVIQVD
jgi:hypothetical protein